MSSINFPQPPQFLFQAGLSNLIHARGFNQGFSGPQTNTVIDTVTVPANNIAYDGQMYGMIFMGRTTNPTGALVMRAQLFNAGVLANTLVSASKAAVAGTTCFIMEIMMARVNSNSIDALIKTWFNIPDNTSTPAAVTPVVNRLLASGNFGVDQSVTLDLTCVGGDSYNHRWSYGYIQ